jgi:hypothetical protein
VFVKEIDRFGFNGSGTFSFNPFEAQIDTGNMMQKLLKAVSNDILILNQQTVTSFVDE